MLAKIKVLSLPVLLAAIVALHTAVEATAQETFWRVSKASGDATFVVVGGSPTGLTNGAILWPGDTVQTGQNGRALLVRGSETILISPGSAVVIPAEAKSKSWTTIQLQSGSILLEVEKRDTRHFEVETPYLAAIVKGTQFRVTIDNTDTRVDVFKGQVEVTDFKSGQYALVHPNQAAKVALLGPSGLSLSGAGTLSPVQQGTPRRSSPSPGEGTAPKAAVAPGTAAKEATPSSTTNGPPVRAAQAGDGAPALLPSRSSFARDGAGSDGPVPPVRGMLEANNQLSRKDEIVLSLSLSLAIGGFVALAVATQRRRQQRKPQRG